MTGPVDAVAVPVLPVADVVRATVWYERLGFECRATFPGYAIVAFDGAEVHLAEMDHLPPPGASVSGAYLRVADADAIFDRWTALGAPPLALPADQPYGIREFATEDLDGNLWRVGSPLAPADDASADPPSSPPAAEPAPGVAASDEPRTDGGPGTDDSAWFELVASGARCAGCGLDTADRPARARGAEVRDEVHAFGELLAEADDDAVRRRAAAGWSALEYGVHVRDLLVVFAERVVRVLAEHEPALGWWDQEDAMADGMANESDVAAVVDDLGRNASKLSESLRMVGDDDWERAGLVGGEVRFTVELLARVALHEVVHHRADAALALAAAGLRDG